MSIEKRKATKPPDPIDAEQELERILLESDQQAKWKTWIASIPIQQLLKHEQDLKSVAAPKSVAALKSVVALKRVAAVVMLLRHIKLQLGLVKTVPALRAAIFKTPTTEAIRTHLDALDLSPERLKYMRRRYVDAKAKVAEVAVILRKYANAPYLKPNQKKVLTEAADAIAADPRLTDDRGPYGVKRGPCSSPTRPA